MLLRAGVTAQCRQVVEDLEAAEQAVNSLQEEVKGHLRIAAPHLIGEALMVPALAELSKQNPSLKIELDLTSTKVTPQGIANLQKALPNCNIISDQTPPKTTS